MAQVRAIQPARMKRTKWARELTHISFPVKATFKHHVPNIRNTSSWVMAHFGKSLSFPCHWVKKGRIKSNRTARNWGARSIAKTQPIFPFVVFFISIMKSLSEKFEVYQ